MEADAGTKTLTGGMYHARDDPAPHPRIAAVRAARLAAGSPLSTIAAYPPRPGLRRIGEGRYVLD